MPHKDYRSELGLHTGKKTVPKPVAIGVLLAVGAVLSYSAMHIVDAAKKRHAPAAAPEAVAPVSPGAQ